VAAVTVRQENSPASAAVMHVPQQREGADVSEGGKQPDACAVLLYAQHGRPKSGEEVPHPVASGRCTPNARAAAATTRLDEKVARS
jgi:hypothetical protein